MTTFSYPPVVPEQKPDPRIFSSAAQQFLVGETIFLRGLEEEDARRSTGWYDSPYPVNPERAEEIIKDWAKSTPAGTIRMVACRRGDGVPVGSLKLVRWPGAFMFTELSLYADPARPDAGRIRAEMLRLIVNWGFAEAELPTILVDTDADQTELITEMDRLKMRHNATWREQVWRDGRWRDRVQYAAYHPGWVELLGMPEAGIDYAVAIDDPRRWRPRQYPVFGQVDGTPPPNAVMVGPRVYLRPLEMEDAVPMIAAIRQERETFFDDGRYPGSMAGYRNRIRRLAESDAPEEVRFAVCLRENDAYIGTNGIMGLDRINRTGETLSFFHSEQHRNAGYGSEAKQLLLAWCFDRMNLHSVCSWVWGPNTRSAAALRKQGYRDAGRAFWEGTKNGKVTYSCAFDLLADEWRQMNERVAEQADVATARA